MNPKLHLNLWNGRYRTAVSKSLGLKVLLIFLGLHVFLPSTTLSGQNNLIPFNFTLTQSATTSAGIFKKDSTLVRTLWNNVRYPAGTHTAYWDRRDDDGFLLTDTSYVVRVMSANVSYTWEGGFIGNTSDSMTGGSKHRYFEKPVSMAIYGNYAYFASGYSEGISSAYKFNLSTPQNRTSILSQIGQVDQSTPFTATDGTNVYWAGFDAFSPGVSFVYATTVAGDKESKFSSGSSVSMTYGRTYNYAIDVITGNSSAHPSGLAVQKNGPFLFVSHEGINELHILNKTTGALVQSVSINSPRQLCVDMNDNLWMIYSTDSVEKFAVDSAGNLSSALLSITGLSEPVALAVSPNNYIVLIADAGTSHQLKAFDNVSGTSVWTLGQSGGYDNDPTVTNDKFYFKDLDRGVKFGVLLAFQSDSSFWIGDPGNDRVLHFSSNRTYLNTIASMPCTYSVRADPNDPTRVFNDFLEFKIDYSKPLAPNNGSWKLVRNWRRGVPLNFFGSYAIFRNVITLSNGKTYATLEDPGNIRREFVELPATGHVRFTGIRLNSDEEFMVDNDGTLRIMYTGGVTDSIRWTSRTLTGFSNDNPVWSTPVTIASSPRTTIKDPKPNGMSLPAKTNSDRLVVFCPRKNDGYGLRDGYHLGVIKKGSRQWLWKTSKATDVNYQGPMPTDGTFDIGNGVEYPAGNVYAIENNIFWNYNGEFWKNSQTNIWNHYADNGLMIGQYGIVSPDGEAICREAFPMGAGNVFSSAFVKVGNDYYLYHNDESVHGAMHRWKISGLNTISEQSSVISCKTVNGGLMGSYFDGTDLNNFNFKTALVNSTVDIAAPPTQISNSSNYSARWSGFVMPAYSQNYTFYTSTGKGVRLWVDNVLIIDQWGNSSLTQYSSTPIALQAGKRYAIKMEINGGSAQLSWSSASQTKQIIPSSALYPSEMPDYSKSYDLMEGLKHRTMVENNLYGWSRNPATDNNISWDNFWNVKTGVRSFKKEKTDLMLRFRKNGSNYTVSRDLGQAQNCLNSWKLKGVINFDENFPEITNETGGMHIEVLDNAGKVILRLTHEMVYQNNINPSNIKINGTVVFTKPQKQIEGIINKNQPFTIDVTASGIVFTYAGYPSVSVAPLDNTSKWNKPSSFNVRFISRSATNYDQVVDFQELVFEPVINKATVTASGPTTFCQGQSVTLTASNGSSYLWSNNATTKSILVSSGAAYSVKVTDALGCQMTSPTTNVTVNALPSAIISSSGPTNICQGDSVTLSVPAASTYLWNNGASTRTITVNNNGNFSVTVTDNNGCSNSSITKNVTVNPLPTVDITANGPITFCKGGSVDLSTSFNGTYLWSNQETTQSIKVTEQGMYALLGTDNNGCKGVSGIIAVTVNPAPDTIISPDGPTAFCTGSSVTLTAAPASSYLWNTNETTQSIVVSKAGSYFVNMENEFLCKSTSQNINVLVNEKPKPSIIVNKDLLTSTATEGNQWFLNGTPIPNATGQIYKAMENGNYNVEVDLNGCKGNSETVVVSNISSVDEKNTDKFIKLYPNPAQGSFTIETKPGSNARIAIYNAIGEVIFETSSDGSLNIDMQGYSSGTYFVKIVIDGNSYNRILILQ